jgi:hypothetical protein
MNLPINLIGVIRVANDQSSEVSRCSFSSFIFELRTRKKKNIQTINENQLSIKNQAFDQLFLMQLTCNNEKKISR